MLLSGFTSPRRLALLAAAVFVTAILFLSFTHTEFSEYLRRPKLPGFSTGYDAEQKSSLEEEQDAPGRVEISSEGELKVPITHLTTSVITASPSSSTTAAAEYDIATGQGHGFRIYPTTTETGSATATSTAADDPNATPTLSPNGTVLDTIDVPWNGNALPKHMTYEEIQANISMLIKSWSPIPIEGHDPPYDYYRDKDYDPNLWEGFEWDNELYMHSGVKELMDADDASETIMTLSWADYSSTNANKQSPGDYVPCVGARGKLLNDSAEDMVRVWPLVSRSFPNSSIGSASALGLDDVFCYDRYNRFGAYGYGQAERAQIDGWQRPVEKLDWSGVQWGQLQDQCLLANQDRYAEAARRPAELQPGKILPDDNKPLQDNTSGKGQQYHARTALVIYSWEGYDYSENDLQAIRAMITELSLLSGGEYQVYLLVNVKDQNADIWNNQQVYDDTVKLNLPRELQGVTILWNEDVLREWYPDVGEWSVYWHQFMPLQWFSETHPEFDFVWNWEPDTRYTGNHYEFLETLSRFARDEPRRYLWERNSRVYLPQVGYGGYEHFVQDTIGTIETAVGQGTLETVWGPQPYNPTEQTPLGPSPPTSQKGDQFQWGRGEDADFLTLSPIFDPKETEWKYRDLIFNFIPGIRPQFSNEDPESRLFHHPDFANIPRRASVGTTAVRFSRRQLHAMHLENRAGRAMVSEMWPATVALQHGLKAVYVPNPVWTSRQWPAWYADAVFNADHNQTARWSSASDSVFNPDRSHNLQGLSFSPDPQSGFATVLYRRWLGFAAYEDEPVSLLDGLGGKNFEEGGYMVNLDDGKGEQLVGGMGRMCLPAMLLHPVRKTRETDEPPEREFMEPGG